VSVRLQRQKQGVDDSFFGLDDSWWVLVFICPPDVGGLPASTALSTWRNLANIFSSGCGALACANRFNLHTLWGILVLAGLGIGGIVVPASIITTIICPDDLIATVTALTLAIRVIGGSVGYCVYYNVFINKFIPNATKMIGGAMIYELGITNKTYIGAAIEYTGASLLPLLQTIPGIAGNQTAYDIIVLAGQEAYAASYKYVYFASIAFGSVSILAACFLGDIGKYMDDHVAVVMHWGGRLRGGRWEVQVLWR
jgi:hypothetical protein